MTNLFVDFETRSPVELRGAGAYRYASDPATEMLLMGYAFDDDPVVVSDTLPKFFDVFLDGPGLIVAHNAQFERLIFKHVLGIDIPIERFACTAAMARSVNLPAKLDALAGLLLGEMKNVDGAKLIRKFCRPPKKGEYPWYVGSSDEWERFKDYCRQDVHLERELYKLLSPGWTQQSREDYYVSERINDRGIQLDVPLAEAAAARAKEIHVGLRKDIQKVTNGEVRTPRGTKVTQWVYGHLSEGWQRGLMRVEGKVSLDKNVRASLLASRGLYYDVRKVLEICEDASSGSVAKYGKALERHVDGRLHGSYILDGGSTTGRYSAVGVQPQNLPQGHVDDYEDSRREILAGRGKLTDLKDMIRATLVPKSGHAFVCSDLKQIEGRVLPWLADTPGGRAKLAVFADPERDVYMETASVITGEDSPTPEQRQSYGKVPELALGFGGAVGALMRMASTYQVDMSEELASDVVALWRKANAWAPAFWGVLSRAALLAFKHPGSYFPAGRVRYVKNPEAPTLYCILPDDSLLHYNDVRLGAEGLSSAHTRFQPKAGESEWPRVRLWHGILAENITQATAARIQRAILRRLDQAGYAVVGHSHDEVLVEVPWGGKEAQEHIHEIVTERPEWASDLPLHSEGWHGKYYRK